MKVLNAIRKTLLYEWHSKNADLLLASVLPVLSHPITKTHQLQCRKISHTSKNEVEEKNVIKASNMNVPIPNVPFHERLWSQCDKWQDATALVCGVTGKELKYYELRNLSLKFASVLQERLHLGQGQVLAVSLPNCLEYVQILLGAFELGVVPTTINSIYTPNEIGRQLRDSDAKAIVTTPEKIPHVKEACSQFGLKDVKIVTLGSTDLPPDVLSYDKLMKETPAPPILYNKLILKSEHETMFIPYSSGTSGKPKGVCLSHRNLLANLMSWDRAMCSLQKTDDWQEVILLVLPLFHIYGFAIMSDAIFKGSKLIVLPGLIENAFIQSLTHYKATLLYAVPPLVTYMNSSPKFGPTEFKRLRAVISGAAPMSSLDVNAFLAKVKRPVQFSQGYGLTETSPIVTDISTSTTNFDSVGRPVMNTMIKVVDPTTGEALPPSQTGEICIKSPQVMKGYLNNVEATKRAIDSDSWFHSGDIGHYDEDGKLYVTDRLKDLIKVKGFQVAPAEVEAALRSHPSVADAGVIGVTDLRQGETPIAFVELAERRKLDVEALKTYLSGFLAKYKIPSNFVHVKSIPKSASGKILRKDLKSLANSLRNN